jgi:DUF4097 and DUF4098 domain-containing protein YvlB
MSDARKKILSMLAEGKITVEESEELLSAIDGNRSQASQRKEEQEPPKRSARFEDDDDDRRESEKFENPFSQATKLGFDLRNLAQTVQQTVQTAIKKAEPRSKEFKERMKEFGTWMHDVVGTMATEMSTMKGDPLDGVTVDFVAGVSDDVKNCKSFVIENIFGEIRIHKADEFKIRVMGRVGKSTMGEYQPSQWFSKQGIRVKDETVYIGFDKNQPVKAVMDMEIALPEEVMLKCKTVSAGIKIRGKFKVEELKTVSGNIRIQGADLKDSLIETVSGSVQIEGGEIAMQIKSTSGDFLVKSSNISRLKINSVSGDILLTEGNITEETEVSLATTSGDIIVEKMSGPWSLVEATTRSGDVVLDWRGDVTPLNNQGTQLKSGSEGGEFKADSVSGDIQFT